MSADAAYAAAARDSITTVAGLQAEGLVSAAEAESLRPLEQQYRLRVPRYYANLIDRDNLRACPIRLQALPSLCEADVPLPAWAAAWSQRAFGAAHPWRADAIGDVAHLVAPRLTHRYVARALLHLSSSCAMYCRFCFRKSHLNDAERPLYRGHLGPAFAYLRAHPEVHELILTGGDPLAVADERLETVLHLAATVPHLRVLRLHTRMAATLPARVTPALCARLGAANLSITVVHHFNHPRELTAEASAALLRLRRAGAMLLNQSVLLKGVNDDIDTLEALFMGLYARGVHPYYLHHPDWTPGTFHFRVPIARGQALMEGLWGRLSGPACPAYMLDLPGGGGKVRLCSRATEVLESCTEGSLGGALLRLVPPATRATAVPQLYLDLFNV